MVDDGRPLLLRVDTRWREPAENMTSVNAIDPPLTPRQVQVARDAWRALPWRVRRDVLRHARRGERHPNLHAASAAYRWACTVIPPDESASERRSRYLGAAGFGLVVDLAVGALLGDSSGAATGSALGALAADRRVASRILRLGPPPTL